MIFAGYTGSKNQVRTRQKIEFVLKSIFFEFEIEKKSSDTRYFKNQVEIDRGYVMNDIMPQQIFRDVNNNIKYCATLLMNLGIKYLFIIKMSFFQTKMYK